MSPGAFLLFREGGTDRKTTPNIATTWLTYNPIPLMIRLTRKGVPLKEKAGVIIDEKPEPGSAAGA
jgi:hypothetical protein